MHKSGTRSYKTKHIHITFFQLLAHNSTMEAWYYYLSIFLIFFFFIFIKHKIHCNTNLPPSPPSLPIIGHLHLLKNTPHLSLQSLLKKYGPILFLKYGSQSVLVTSSPSVVEECFTKNDIIFANRPRSMAGDHLGYNHTTMVFSPYCHLWRQVRRLAAIEIFSQKSLHKFSFTREEETRSLVRNLLKVSGHGDQKVDLKSFFSLLAFNIMTRTVSGKKCVEDDVACTDMGKQRLRYFKSKFAPMLLTDICDYVPILRWIGYKGTEKKLIRFQKERDQVLQEMIDEIRDMESTKNTSREKNLIETLLTLQETEPDFFSDVIIKSIIQIMFVAGTDTSSVTLEWAMSLLLNHPEEMQKVRAEINRVTGNKRLIKDSDLLNLPYLRCVINETLRLYPAAPLLLPHYSSEKCQVLGYEIPKGTMLVVNAWALHRDPQVWEEPNKFKPWRFKGAEEEGEKHVFKFIPFGIGRRTCPGANMAIRLIMLALGTLIQCFEWERVDGEMVYLDQATGVTMPKAKPLEAICRPCSYSHSLISQFLDQRL